MTKSGRGRVVFVLILLVGVAGIAGLIVSILEQRLASSIISGALIVLDVFAVLLLVRRRAAKENDET